MRSVTAEDGTLQWPGRVVSALELERLRHGIGKLVIARGCVVTPSAHEWLRQHGVSVTTETVSKANPSGWRIAQERPFAVVQSAIEALRREGTIFEPWPERGEAALTEWARRLAEDVANASGAVVFTMDAALACCVANKLTAIRGAAVTTVLQAQQAMKSLAANWLAVEMPGRSLFEVRQILKLAGTSHRVVPTDLETTLNAMGDSA